MAQYPVQVLARITAEDAARLDEVAAMEPALPNRPAAVRRLIAWLDDDDLATDDAAEGKEDLPTLHPDDVASVLSALEERTRVYSELIKQQRAIGNNLNQLVRLGHQITKYGAAGTIPTAAVEGLGRKHDEALERMATLAEQDAHVEEVVRACRPR